MRKVLLFVSIAGLLVADANVTVRGHEPIRRSLPDSFNPGVNGAVYDMAVQPDGRVIVAGSFSVLGGAVRWNIGRLNPDGSLDPTFNPGANGAVRTVEVQPDGRILVGGDFLELGCASYNCPVYVGDFPQWRSFFSHLGRLNANGSLDASFNPGADGPVYDIELQPHGRILVAGGFSTLGCEFAPSQSPQPHDCRAGGHAVFPQIERWHIGRLSADGTPDANGVPRNGLLDATFNPGANSLVKVLELQPDGKILVGGGFGTLGCASQAPSNDCSANETGDPVYRRWHIGRLHADGTPDAAGVPRNGMLDLTFNPGANNVVNTIAVQLDGKILVGGGFSTLGCESRVGGNTCSANEGGSPPYRRWFIGRLNADGTPDANGVPRNGMLDPTFNPGTDFEVHHVDVQPSGKIIVAGSFTALGCTSVLGSCSLGIGLGHPVVERLGIGRLNADGSLDPNFKPGENGTQVYRVSVQADCRILIGGLFSELDGAARANLGRMVDPDALEEDPGPPAVINADGFDPGANALVNAIAVQPDGKILVGGDFSTLGGGGTGTIVRLRLGRLNADGSLDPTFNPGANGGVRSLVVQPDGKILVGGFFSSIGGVARSQIARLNPNGSIDQSFNPGANGVVWSMALQADGKIVAVGNFTMLGGGQRSRIGRLNANGSLDQSFDPSVNTEFTGENTGLFAIAVQSNGQILVGGQLITIGGVRRASIGRVNADGSLDTTFDPGADSNVLALAVQPDGKILVGGQFTKLGGGGTGKWWRSRIARLHANGSLDASFDSGVTSNPLDAVVYTLAVQADGKVLIGGGFTGCGSCIGGQAPVSGIARLLPNGRLDPTFGPGVNHLVLTLGLQADGKVLVGGFDFTTLGGGGTGTTARRNIGRLSNTSAAVESLSVTDGGATVVWTRSGTSPEVRRVTFESSTNGTQYALLGNGTRVGTTWRLTGQSLTTAMFVRARGYYPTGYGGGSASIAESIRAGVTPGQVSGSVTDSVTSAPLGGVTVQIFGATGSFVRSALTSASGAFSITGLAQGTYYARTFVSAGQGYSDELFDDLPCGSSCAVTDGTPIDVTTGVSTTGIDFTLAPAGRISGTITSAATGAPISGVNVRAFTTSGGSAGSSSTSGAGTFTITPLASGSYYVLASPPGQYLPEYYGGGSGTPVAVTSGATSIANFALKSSATISGTVTDAVSGLPIPDANVVLSTAFGTFVASESTTGQGTYTIGGLPPGTYYATTVTFTNHIDERFSNLPCEPTCMAQLGTPLTVTSGAAVGSVDFALSPGGSIAGTVTDALSGAPLGGVYVRVLTATGIEAGGDHTTPVGVYTITGLGAGSHFARTEVASSGLNYVNSIYNNLPCFPECPVTSGTPIAVTPGVPTTGINFALSRGGWIAGTITDATTGLPTNNVRVQVYTAGGVLAAETNVSEVSGGYVVPGLPAGTYFARTVGNTQWVNELYNSGQCVPTCTVTDGAPIAVTVGATTGSIDFSLETGGSISGTVTDAVTGASLESIPRVEIYSANGVFVKVTSGSPFEVHGLPAGAYYARAEVEGRNYVKELYGGLLCLGVCNVLAGEPISVTAGATTTGVNFALSPGGSIAGVAIDEVSGGALMGIEVRTYSSSGALASRVTTGADGSFLFAGLPGGNYFARTSNAAGYIDERFNGGVCLALCTSTITSGTPIPVEVNVTTTGVNFALAPGGRVSGRVTSEATGVPLGLVTVNIYTSSGALATRATSDAAGEYVTDAGLPTGTYFVRTSNTGSYRDEIFNNQALCSPNCLVTSGAPVSVISGGTTTGIDFALAPGTELITNGDFSHGTAGWFLFATPDLSYIQWQILESTDGDDELNYLSGGVFQYYRVPPAPGTLSTAVILQGTGVALPAQTPLLAHFDVGNSSSTRKRVIAIVHDLDFTDLSVCTFWLEPNTPLTTYAMRTHNTKAWTSTTISFYAASAGSVGGFYELDNVSLQIAVGSVSGRTDCIDPTVRAASGGADGPELVINGGFSAGATPGWTTFGQIVYQVIGGVFEFYRPQAQPHPTGVILQATGYVAAAGELLTARFDLGNSSTVRKRATVILHDLDFSDLTACTFWLEPGQPLSTYTMRGFPTKAWANTTIAIYASTIGDEAWIRLDNVSLRSTPSAAVTGATCIEPAAGGSAARSPVGTTGIWPQDIGETTIHARPHSALRIGRRRSPHGWPDSMRGTDGW